MQIWEQNYPYSNTQDIWWWIIGIDFPHHEIHKGDHYYFCDYQLWVALNWIINFTLTTPNTTTYPHFSFAVSASLWATIEVFEWTTWVSLWTAITPRNNNRNSSNTSIMTILKNPTITSDWTRAAWYLCWWWRVGWFIEREEENILKQNTTYLLRITSLANSNDIGWCASWYEK